MFRLVLVLLLVPYGKESGDKSPHSKRLSVEAISEKSPTELSNSRIADLGQVGLRDSIE